MAITKKTTRRVMPSTRVTASSRMPARRPMGSVAPRAINAGRSITASARARSVRPQGVTASKVQLTPAQRIFANQIINTTRRMSVMGADLKKYGMKLTIPHKRESLLIKYSYK